jgi:hypothetical protein
MAWPEFVAPRRLPRVSAMIAMTRPTSPPTKPSGNNRKEIAATVGDNGQLEEEA